MRPLAAALVAGLATVAALWLAAAVSPWPAAVRTSSMMHDPAEVPFGRVGTLDPGDMVLLAGRTPIAAPDADADSFGARGDVVLFHPLGDRARPAILHRVVGTVEVVGGEVVVRGAGCDPCRGNASGLYSPALGFDEGAGFRPDAGWAPARGGLLTRGDNPVTNARVDAATGLSCGGAAGGDRRGCLPVDPAWVVGVAAAEIPWLGLPRVVLSGEPNPAPTAGAVRIGDATAPWDLWLMLVLASGALAAPPAVAAGLVARRRAAARG